MEGGEEFTAKHCFWNIQSLANRTVYPSPQWTIVEDCCERLQRPVMHVHDAVWATTRGVGRFRRRAPGVTTGAAATYAPADDDAYVPALDCDLQINEDQFYCQPQNLYNLYLAYKGEHHQVYVNTATASIATIASNYSAYTFFNDKQGIAASMQISLNDIFTKQLFASIDALQISQVELPAVFQEAILESISTKQNITRSERYKENMEVTFTTQRMVAQQEAIPAPVVAAVHVLHARCCVLRQACTPARSVRFDTRCIKTGIGELNRTFCCMA
jgi:hypothetical protein